MNPKYKLAISIVSIIAMLLIVFNKQTPQLLESISSKINEILNPAKNESLIQPELPQTLGNENKTNETNQTGGGKPGSSPLPGSVPSQQESTTTLPKALTLEIIDICSGKFEEVFVVSEGMRYCLNQKYPYYIILEKNSTHLHTSFYNTSGFNETYELNESVLMFYIFVEDVASVSTIIQSFYIEGDINFYLGNYDLHTIWERDASGNLAISKMIVALPLNVKNTVSTDNEWKEIKFYLNIPDKTYYLGNLWVLVKPL